jgi:adenosylcobinamide-GDP ribazoletransferase
MFELFKAALGFLSIIPSGRQKSLEPEEFGRFPAFYPAVGLVFGLLLYLVHFLLSPFLPAGALAVILCAFLIILNRGFHVDGLADAADALFSHKSLEQKLIILKDSRQGTFGVLAIVLDVLLKVQLLESALPLAPWILILWPVWGRAAASVVAVRSDYVRSEGGLGRWMVENSGHKELLLAALFSILLSVFGGWAAIASAHLALFFGFFLTWVWKKSLGGVTGDLLGASIELCEILTIVVFYMLIA